MAHTPIGDIVDGLDEVAHLRIPYAQLPRRARTVYSAEYVYWSDLADQTVSSLLSRPKIGDAAVQAMLAAANDAVAEYRAASTSGRVGAAAAVARLLEHFDETDRVILSTRIWAARPQPQPAVAERLGVHPVSVRRNQTRIEVQLAELLANPTHHEVSEHTAELHRRLGPYAPADTVAAELRRLAVDPGTETAQLLLHLAGPYMPRDGWFENTTTGGQQQVVTAVDAVFDRCPAPSTAKLIQALTDLGMPPDVTNAYLDSGQQALRRFGDVWVRWDGSIHDKAEAVLHARGAPATPDDILTAIGAETTTSQRALREALYADHRFARASVRTWGLHTWGIEEYTSVFDEVAVRVDASGGTMTVDEIVADVRSRFPDVAESSVRTYLGSTLAFINDAGRVRRRTDTDKWPPIPPLNTVRGAFRLGRKEIRLAITVTADMLRGSGLQIRPAVAAALGVDPGQRRVFTSPHGQLPVVWRLSSTNGPSIGSLRAHTMAAAANLQDTLVLTFSLNDASLNVTRIDAETAGIQRLQLLLGRTVRKPAAALAASLNCRQADVAAVLRNRGDDDLADLTENYPAPLLRALEERNADSAPDPTTPFRED